MAFFRPQEGGSIARFPPQGGGFDCKAPDGKYSQASLVLMAFFGRRRRKIRVRFKVKFT